MANARERIEAFIERLACKGPVEAEGVEFDGKPLVRRIFRKDLS